MGFGGALFPNNSPRHPCQDHGIRRPTAQWFEWIDPLSCRPVCEACSNHSGGTFPLFQSAGAASPAFQSTKGTGDTASPLNQ